MKRLNIKDKKKYLNQITRSHVFRRTGYFRRNLHINHRQTDIKIIYIKNRKQFFYQIKGLKELDGLECFYIYHVFADDISKWLLNIKDSDIIYTDSRTNKVFAINEKSKRSYDFINIWILKRNAVDFLKIKLGDILFTR